MADFTRYGAESSDWADYMKSHPPAVLLKDLTPLQLQDTTNQGRESNSKEIQKGLASKYLTDFQTDVKADTFCKADISTRDLFCPTSDEQTIPIRIYRSSLTISTSPPVFVFFHGGGYCFGTLSSEDGFCSWMAENAGIIVVNVCYRHTPQWKWPVQREDAYNALNWVFDNMSLIGGDKDKVLVGGRSSGSNLSAGVALRDKDIVSNLLWNV